ncbi:cyclic nucleotide-binding/CBS domain-containing protein [Methyloversatilis sp.]|uniref:CBS domain-containing protein n=1 Tax=Methyloversatilis sp. TaxID=2569862 RepID=UPI0035B0DA8D
MKKRCLSLVIQNRQPVLLRGEDTVSTACRLMRERPTGAVLVVDADERLRGIFTGRDAVRLLAEGRQAADTLLIEAMTPDPHTIGPEATSIDALREMADRGFRHLPVVEGGRILGVVSRGDFKGMELERLGDETTLWERIC